MADWAAEEKELRETARRLLSEGKADVVIGYGAGTAPGTAVPVFVRTPADADRLVWGPHCHHNLAVYLTRKEVRALGKPAVVAMGCTVRAILVLVQESQLRREDLVILGMACEGMGDPLFGKCRTCDVRTPGKYDILIGEKIPPADGEIDDPEAVRLAQASPAERWAYWTEAFSRCIRCYACRAACPMCYCERCIVEKNQPQWVSSAPELKGNLNWNVTRAMHLAGRCVECEACERACPVDIPLMRLNRDVARIVADRMGGYRAGYDTEAKPVMADFDAGDEADFIR